MPDLGRYGDSPEVISGRARSAVPALSISEGCSEPSLARRTWICRAVGAADASVGQSVCCPWCRRTVRILAAGVLETHAPSYALTSRDCSMSGHTPERARELTDESIAYHAATGDDMELPDA